MHFVNRPYRQSAWMVLLNGQKAFWGGKGGTESPLFHPTVPFSYSAKSVGGNRDKPYDGARQSETLYCCVNFLFICHLTNCMHLCFISQQN